MRRDLTESCGKIKVKSHYFELAGNGKQEKLQMCND